MRNNRSVKEKIILLLLILIAFFSYSQDGMMDGEGEESNPKMKQARRVVNNGEIKILEGILIGDNNGDWYLKVNNKKYLIHFGPDFYFEELNLKLKNNDKLKIEGFFYLEQIAPILFIHNKKEYRFWLKNGDSVWKGKGKMNNKK
jgi:hypothetical protein